MRRIEADLSRLDEVIAKQYEDKIRGLAKDSIQNSWAARKTKKGLDFKTVFKFYRKLGNEENVLLIEDYGTYGMGETEWNAFHSHWKSTKKEYETGRVSRWGQGKTLFLYFSKTKRILTESIDEKGVYRCSARTNEGYWQLGDVPEASDPNWTKNSDGSLREITDFLPIKPLDHQGARIWILNVREELATDILAGQLVEQLSESWWEIILKHGAKLEYEEYASQLVKTVQITLPHVPETEDEVESEPSKPIPVSNGAKIRNLKLILTKSDVKDSLRGIAIQRGGMTVVRYDSLSIPDDFKTRVFGYCIPDDELDRELYEIEMANHEGFEARKTVWVYLRKKIDEEIEKFLAPHIQKKQAPKPEVDQEEILKIVNKIVEDYVGEWGQTVVKLPVRFEPWAYKGTNRRFESGDILQHNAGVKNTTDSAATVKVKRWIEGKGRYFLFDTEAVKIPKKRTWKLQLPDIDFKKSTLPSGEYTLKGQLMDAKGQTLHVRGVKFYLGVDPPPTKPVVIKPEEGHGHIWLKQFDFGGIHDKSLIQLRNLPYRREDASVLINDQYVEFRGIMSAAVKGKIGKVELVKRLRHYIVNVLLSEASKEYVMRLFLQEDKEFGPDQIREGKEVFDRMWNDFVDEYGVMY